MDFSSHSSERLIHLVEQISDALPERAYELFREDRASLETYLGSRAFLEDLISEESPVTMDLELFYLILFKQFLRKLGSEPGFRESFFETVHQTQGRSVSQQRARQFFNDQDLVGYMVNMLKQFANQENLYNLPGDDSNEDTRYIFEMIEVALDASEGQAFQIFCHIGNYSLFLTGIFPDWVEHRYRYKNRPMDIDSYSNYGRQYFERASRHSMARRQNLEQVLTKLHLGYDMVRASLNLMFKQMTPAF